MMGVAMGMTVLKAGVHDRLVQDIDQVAAMSRVPASMIRQSSVGVLSPALVKYIASFRKLRELGLANGYLTAPLKKTPERIMMAMAAALIRNFIDARVFTLQNLIAADEDYLIPTAIFVPNFQNTFVGKPLASHQLQKLYSILLDRAVQDKVTVLYVENKARMMEQYGTAISDFVLSSYTHLME